MRVRHAQPIDLKALRRLHRDLYGYHHANCPSIFKKVPREGADESEELDLERTLVCSDNEAVVKREGCDSIEVPVFSFNTGALSFYERRGYGEYVRRLRKVFSSRGPELAPLILPNLVAPLR